MSSLAINNPNHRHYGPARRLWIILSQLMDDYNAAEARFEKWQGLHWCDWLVQMLDVGKTEKQAQRKVVEEMMGY